MATNHWKLVRATRTPGRLFGWAMFFVAVYFNATSLFGAEPIRTWTDSTGKNRIRGSLVDFSQSVATLKQADGSVIRIHQNRLSIGDRRYLANFEKKRNADWVKKLKPGFTVEARNKANFWLPAEIVAVNGRRYRVSFFNYDGEEEVGLDRLRRYAGVTLSADVLRVASIEWQEPEAGRVSVNASASIPREDPLMSKVFRLGHVQFPLGILACGESVLVAGMGDERTQLYWCDTGSGEVRGPGEAMGHQQLAAISAAGDRVATFAGLRQEQLQLWRLTKDEVTPQPDYLLKIDATASSSSARTIGGFTFAGSDRAVVGIGRTHFGKKIVLWDIDAKKPITGWEGEYPSVSSDGKRLAFASKDGVRLVNLETGKQFGLISKSPGLSAFSPDGSMLAIKQGLVLEIHDLRVPAKEPRLIQTPVGVGAPLLWTSNSHILINQQVLADVEKQVVVWKYERRNRGPLATPTNLMDYKKDRFYYVEKDRSSAAVGVIVCDLPDEATKRIINTRSRDAIHIAPGNSVQLVIKSTGIPLADVEPHFTKIFERNKWKPDAGAAVVLRVTIDEKEFKGMRDKRYECRATLKDPTGEVVWRGEFVGTRESIRKSFADMSIPSTFADAKYKEGFGYSHFTHSGVSIQDGN